ncbi:hypothetical protein [Pseudonocardia sp.]|uniref:hypothetical protein n=1 Tax=Pseudonocardia sp. TaxID=60912 RepID=UPI0031FC6056
MATRDISVRVRTSRRNAVKNVNRLAVKYASSTGSGSTMAAEWEATQDRPAATADRVHISSDRR